LYLYICGTQLGDLANSIRNRTDIHFGLYHSLMEWFNPLFLNDVQNGYKTQQFADVRLIYLIRSKLIQLLSSSSSKA